MKQEFSKRWKSSTQVRKQRKYRANAPLHIKAKMMGCHLSKDLRTKYSTRSLGIRKGDDVKVLRGKFKGKTGKINLVNIKKQRVAIDGLQNKKKDGTKINVYFDTSNLQIQKLHEGDKRRLKRLTKKHVDEKPKSTEKEEKNAT